MKSENGGRDAKADMGLDREMGETGDGRGAMSEKAKRTM